MRPDLDAAEVWLQEHDPDYATSRQAWKHVRGEEIITPRQEVPVGLTVELETVVSLGKGAWVNPVIYASSEDRCDECRRSFMVYKRGHRFCSKACRNRSHMRKRREQLRP